MEGVPVELLIVIAGGAIGGILRYVISHSVTTRSGRASAGTLVVNVSGAALIGLAAGLVATTARNTPHVSWLFFIVGILGSYTTVSAFSLQTFELIKNGRIGAALANVASSVILCVGAATLFYTLAKVLLP